MKNTTIYGIGALVIIAGAGFLYFKNKKTTSLLETAFPNNAGTSNAATATPTKPPLSSTINPSSALTSLDLNIAALPGSTTLAEIQPLIQQQQIANAQAEIEKQHQAEDLAKQIQNNTSSKSFYCNKRDMFGNTIKNNSSEWMCNDINNKIEILKSKIAKLGYYEQNGNAIKI